MKRAGACWTREGDSARFADGRNFCLKKEGSVGKEFVSLAFLSFSRGSLSASHTRAFRALFAAEKNYDETRLCSSFYHQR